MKKEGQKMKYYNFLHYSIVLFKISLFISVVIVADVLVISIVGIWALLSGIGMAFK